MKTTYRMMGIADYITLLNGLFGTAAILFIILAVEDLHKPYYQGGLNTNYIWLSKQGQISIEDKLIRSESIRHIMYSKRAADPQLTISIKADKAARMGLVSDIHTELRKADALMLNYSSKTAID